MIAPSAGSHGLHRSLSSQRLLIDAGPLISLFVPKDRQHARVVDFFRSNVRTLVSTWGVLAEASHLIGRASLASQLDFVDWVAHGALTLLPVDDHSLLECTAYLRRYSDLPMDLADATLVVAAISTGLRDIASLDKDFDIYRLPDRTKLTNVLAPLLHRSH
jgi:predicted nucleic acid-binding protein